MSTQTEACDHQRIDHFLNSDQVAIDDVALIDHLDTCESCRGYMERQAADSEQWTKVAEMLKSTELDDVGSADFSSANDPKRRSQSLAIQTVLDSLAPSDDPHSLGRLSGYEVSGVVGVGGMGVVLKAVDPALDRVVAIKVMAAHLANNATARRRFSREAKAAAAVLHLNVIPIHSVSSGDVTPHLVMAYIRGGSLQKRLDNEGPLPTVEILRIGSQVAAGLAAAHEQGLVHRDIKPENILLEEGVERVTLTDFGLARAVDDASVTREGTIAGTPQYMSPEQARGESVDQQSDLFSLGSVLYALCTGRPPFRAESAYGVMRRICDNEPTPIRELNPEIPEWLCEIVETLMSKKKADRFESAAKVHEILEACLNHVQQPTAVELPAQLTTKPKNQTSWIRVATVMAGLLFFVCMGVVYYIQTDKGTVRVEVADESLAVTITGQDVTLKDGDKQPVTLRSGEHQLVVRQGETELLTETFQLRRGEQIVFKAEFLKGNVVLSAQGKELQSKSIPTELPEISGNEEQTENLKTVEVKGAGEFPRLHAYGAKSLAVSPDGTLLASASQMKVLIRKVSNGEIVTEINGAKGSVVFGPRGKVLAAVNLSGVFLWDISEGKKMRTFKAEIHPYNDCYGVAISPNGQRVALGSDRGLKVWDLDSGEEQLSISGHLINQHVTAVVFSPDGEKIASANWGGYISVNDGETVKAPNEVKVWDAKTGKQLAALPGGGHGVAFSPDGKRIASGNYFEGSAIVWDIETKKELHLRGHKHGVGGIAFSPDGAWLATAGRDNLVKVWDLQRGKEAAILGHGGEVKSVAFSPYGKRLYSASEDKSIRKWEFSVHKKPLKKGQEGPNNQEANQELLTPPAIELRWATSEHIPGFTHHENRGDYTGDAFYSLKPVLTLTPELVESVKHVSGTFPPSGDRIFHWVTIKLNEKAMAQLESAIAKVKSDPAKAKKVEYVTLLVDGKEGFSATLLLGWKSGIFKGPNYDTAKKPKRIVETLTAPKPAQLQVRPLFNVAIPDGIKFEDADIRISDDQTLVLVGKNGEHLLRVDEEKRTAKAEPISGWRGMQFIPGKRVIVTKTWDKAVLRDPDEPLRAFPEMPHKMVEGDWINPVVSSDGTILATRMLLDHIHCWDLQTLRSLGEPIKPDGNVSRMQITPDSKHLCLHTNQGLEFWNPRRSVRVAGPFRDGPYIHGLMGQIAYDPVKERVATVENSPHKVPGEFKSRIVIRSLQDDQAKTQTIEVPAHTTCVLWPDPNHLIVSGGRRDDPNQVEGYLYDHYPMFLIRLNDDAIKPAELAKHVWFYPVLTSDGQYVIGATNSETLCWKVGQTQPAWRMPGRSKTIQTAKDWVLLRGFDGSARVHAVATGETLLNRTSVVATRIHGDRAWLFGEQRIHVLSVSTDAGLDLGEGELADKTDPRIQLHFVEPSNIDGVTEETKIDSLFGQSWHMHREPALELQPAHVTSVTMVPFSYGSAEAYSVDIQLTDAARRKLAAVVEGKGNHMRQVVFVIDGQRAGGMFRYEINNQGPENCRAESFSPIISAKNDKEYALQIVDALKPASAEPKESVVGKLTTMKPTLSIDTIPQKGNMASILLYTVEGELLDGKSAAICDVNQNRIAILGADIATTRSLVKSLNVWVSGSEGEGAKAEDLAIKDDRGNVVFSSKYQPPKIQKTQQGTLANCRFHDFAFTLSSDTLRFDTEIQSRPRRIGVNLGPPSPGVLILIDASTGKNTYHKMQPRSSRVALAEPFKPTESLVQKLTEMKPDLPVKSTPKPQTAPVLLYTVAGKLLEGQPAAICDVNQKIRIAIVGADISTTQTVVKSFNLRTEGDEPDEQTAKDTTGRIFFSSQYRPTKQNKTAKCRFHQFEFALSYDLFQYGDRSITPWKNPSNVGVLILVDASTGKFTTHSMKPKPKRVPLKKRDGTAESSKRKTTEFLIDAVKKGELATVEAALKAGVDPNGPQNQLTALHWAVAKRIADGKTIEPTPKIAKMLIDAGANVNAKDYLDQTPLEWAATHASPEVVKMLIDAGANVNAESRYGTVLFAAKNADIAKLLIDAGAEVDRGTILTPLGNASKKNDVAMMRLLIGKGANVNNTKNPPIHWVGTAEAAKVLLKAGADVNLRNSKGETVLHRPGLYFGPNAEAIQLLIDNGADVKATSKTGATPLHAAVYQNKVEMAQALIKAGAELDAKDQQGNTPLSLANQNLMWARTNPSVKDKPYEGVVNMLVKTGAKDDGRTKLQQAVAAGDLAKVKALIADEADVNAIGPQKITAAHLAAENGQVKILNALIEAGALIDQPNTQGLRPIHFAANTDIVQRLIAKGAKVQGGTPSPTYMAAMAGRADVVRELIRDKVAVKDSECRQLLNWTTFAGQLEVVKVLFEERDANELLKPQPFDSPLHIATRGTIGDVGSPDEATPQRRLEIAKVLIEKGADVNAKWGEKIDPKSIAAPLIRTTPLMFAAGRGEIEMVKFLLESGADAKATDASGETALFFAARNGHVGVIERLLEEKIDVNAVTSDGETPLDAAQTPAVKILLIQNGAKTARDILKSFPSEKNK